MCIGLGGESCCFNLDVFAQSWSGLHSRASPLMVSKWVQTMNWYLSTILLSGSFPGSSISASLDGSRLMCYPLSTSIVGGLRYTCPYSNPGSASFYEGIPMWGASEAVSTETMPVSGVFFDLINLGYFLLYFVYFIITHQRWFLSDFIFPKVGWHGGTVGIVVCPVLL